MYVQCTLTQVQNGTAALLKSCQNIAKKLEGKSSPSARQALEDMKATVEEVKDLIRPLDRSIELRKNSDGDPLTAADCFFFRCAISCNYIFKLHARPYRDLRARVTIITLHFKQMRVRWSSQPKSVGRRPHDPPLVEARELAHGSEDGGGEALEVGLRKEATNTEKNV